MPDFAQTWRWDGSYKCQRWHYPAWSQCQQCRSLAQLSMQPQERNPHLHTRLWLQASWGTEQFALLAPTVWEGNRESHETESPGTNSRVSWITISLLLGNINIYNTHLWDTFPRCLKRGWRKVGLLWFFTPKFRNKGKRDSLRSCKSRELYFKCLALPGSLIFEAGLSSRVSQAQMSDLKGDFVLAQWGYTLETFVCLKCDGFLHQIQPKGNILIR